MKKLSIVLFASAVIVLSSCKAKEEAPEAEKVSLEEGIKEMQDLKLDSNNVVAPIADTTKK